jgi:hypothetical protein
MASDRVIPTPIGRFDRIPATFLDSKKAQENPSIIWLTSVVGLTDSKPN